MKKKRNAYKPKRKSDREWLEKAREICRVASNTDSPVPITLDLSSPRKFKLLKILNEELEETGWKIATKFKCTEDDLFSEYYALTYA